MLQFSQHKSYQNFPYKLYHFLSELSIKFSLKVILNSNFIIPFLSKGSLKAVNFNKKKKEKIFGL
jgi:hypothetical protein